MDNNQLRFTGALVREPDFPDRARILGETSATIRDWSGLFLELRDANLLPLAYPELKSGVVTGFPPELAQRVRSEFFRTAAINELMLAEYGELGELCAARGIALVPIKGLELAHTVYSTPGLRPMQDMDFLVRREDAEPARALFESRGFAPVRRYGFERRARAEYELPMYRPGSPRIQVELHWDLIDRMGIKSGFRKSPDEFVAGVWERVRTEPFLGRPTPLLSPEDHLLVILFHIAKHAYRLNQSAPDFYAFVRARGPELDWDRFAQIAARAGMARPLALSLVMLERTGGRCWPHAAAGSLQVPGPDLKLFDLALNGRGSGNEMDELLYWLWLEPGPERLRAAAGFLFPDRDRLSNALGREVTAAAYPLRLAERYARGLGILFRLIAKQTRR